MSDDRTAKDVAASIKELHEKYPTPADRFALMFRGPLKDRVQEKLDMAFEELAEREDIPLREVDPEVAAEIQAAAKEDERMYMVFKRSVGPG